jgi:hypothetical protein
MAAELMLTIDANGKPSGATAGDAEVLASLAGSTYRAVLTQPRGRSLSQLGLYFAMCGKIADNHPGGFSKDDVDRVLRMECGHTRAFQAANGLYYRVPKSIAFNATPAEAFTRFLDLALIKAGELFGADLALAVRRELEAMGAPDLSPANDHTAEQGRAA